MSGAGRTWSPARAAGDHAGRRLRLPRALRRALAPLPALAITLALLVAWELYATHGGVDELLLPAPHDVARALWEDRALLWANLRVTAVEVLLGIAVAAVAGLACAAAVHLSATLRRALYPLLVSTQAVPVPVVAALLAVWLGFGLAPKLVIVALVAFFPIAVTTASALATVDPELRKLLTTLDASRARAFWLVELPAALPGLFAGAKIAVALSVLGAVFAEQSGADAGIGRLIQQAVPQLLTARAYAAVFVLSAFAIALFSLLSAVERRVLPWAFQPRGGHDR